VDALGGLAVRTGLSIHVIFDGVDEGGGVNAPTVPGRQVLVRFSSKGADADEVIVDLVDRLDPSEAVVVATDDRRIRDEVARRGANVISVVQLLAVVGRLPGGNAERGSVTR
jgi:predicted RNA-binding protein with PIN domain